MIHFYPKVSILISVILIVSSCTTPLKEPKGAPLCATFTHLPESSLWAHGNTIAEAHFIDNQNIVVTSAPYSLSEGISTWIIDLEHQTVTQQNRITENLRFYMPCQHCKTTTLSFSTSKRWQIAQIRDSESSKYWLLGASTGIRLKFRPIEWRWSTDGKLLWYSWSVTMGANSALISIVEKPLYVYEDEEQIDALAFERDGYLPGYLGHWLQFTEDGKIIATTIFTNSGNTQNRIASYGVIDNKSLIRQSEITKTNVIRIYAGKSLESSVFVVPTDLGLDLHDINDKPLATIAYDLIRTVYYALKSHPPSDNELNAFRINTVVQDQLIISDDAKHVMALNANGINSRNAYIFACD